MSIAGDAGSVTCSPVGHATGGSALKSGSIGVRKSSRAQGAAPLTAVRANMAMQTTATIWMRISKSGRVQFSLSTKIAPDPYSPTGYVLVSGNRQIICGLVPGLGFRPPPRPASVKYTCPS
jgi:hypothetical protein